MPKGIDVVDIKPKNSLVLDAKPLNSQVLDIKPKLDNKASQDMNQLYSRTITAGMYLGIPIITYSTTFTVISSKS